MIQAGFYSGDDDGVLNYFRRRIENLSPPKSIREELLLEIYQQLFEKHCGASNIDSKRRTEHTTGASAAGSRY